jgi:chaperonin cofactor prefoldin
MATQKNSLKQHEEICALRYEQIEKRLESGSKRFDRIESMIYGVYALIIATQIIGAII